MNTLVFQWYTPNHWLATPANGAAYRYTITDLTGADTHIYQDDLAPAPASGSGNLQSAEVLVSPPSGSGVYRVQVTAYNLNGNSASDAFPTAGVAIGEWQCSCILHSLLLYIFCNAPPFNDICTSQLVSNAGIPAIPGKPAVSAVSPATQITFSFTGEWQGVGLLSSHSRAASTQANCRTS